MNRRKFAKSVLGTIGVSMFAGPSIASGETKQAHFEAGHRMQSDDGLSMTLSQHTLPTHNKDHKQFILTFDVDNPNGQLDEKIYHLTDHHGQRHQIYMKPVDHNQLQAEFNWRTHA